MRRPPEPSLAARYRRSVIAYPGWLRLQRNSVVVITSLIALLTMHRLTTDHGMSMPSMRWTSVRPSP